MGSELEKNQLRIKVESGHGGLDNMAGIGWAEIAIFARMRHVRSGSDAMVISPGRAMRYCTARETALPDMDMLAMLLRSPLISGLRRSISMVTLDRVASAGLLKTTLCSVQ